MHQWWRRESHSQTRPEECCKIQVSWCCGTFGLSNGEKRNNGLLSSGSAHPKPESIRVQSLAKSWGWKDRPIQAWTIYGPGRKVVHRTPWLLWWAWGFGRDNESEYLERYNEDVEEGDCDHDLFGVDGCDSRGIEDQRNVTHYVFSIITE